MTDVDPQPSLPTEEQRTSLWRTAWGVVLAAATAFSIGYAASRGSHPSVGAGRPPLWPLPIALGIGIVALWFVLAPTLHQWPFQERSPGPSAGPEPWLAELTESESPDDAPPLPFHIEPQAGSATAGRSDPSGSTAPSH